MVVLYTSTRRKNNNLFLHSYKNVLVLDIKKISSVSILTSSRLAWRAA
jgi:hypothetical protein